VQGRFRPRHHRFQPFWSLDVFVGLLLTVLAYAEPMPAEADLPAHVCVTPRDRA